MSRSLAVGLFLLAAAGCPAAPDRHCNVDDDCLGRERCAEGTCIPRDAAGEGEGDVAEGEGDAGEGEAGEGEGDAGEGEGDAGEGEGGEGEGDAGEGEGEGDAGEGEGEGEASVCGDGLVTGTEECDAPAFCTSSCALPCGSGSGAAAANLAGDGTCELFFTEALPWADAEAACRGHGGHLASVADDVQNQRLRTMAGATAAAWLGLADVVVEGRFVTVDQTTPLFNRFGGGEPNNGAGAGEEDCVELRPSFNDWNDLSCDVPLAFLCEVAPPAPPCGDGVVGVNEQCDDGGVVDGDGCSAACVVEPNHTCVGSPSLCFSADRIVTFPGGNPDLHSATIEAGDGGLVLVSAGTFNVDGANVDKRVVLAGLPGAALSGRVSVQNDLHIVSLQFLGSANGGLISSNNDLAIEDSELSSPGGDCIASSGASFSLVRSVVHDCGDDGVDLNTGAYKLVDDIVFGAGAGHAGINLRIAPATGARIAHVTVALNANVGVACALGSGAPLEQSIVVGNPVNLTSCSATESIIGGGALGFRNHDGDLSLFIDAVSSTPNLHLLPAGASDLAANASVLSLERVDVDRNERDAFPDLGADER